MQQGTGPSPLGTLVSDSFDFSVPFKAMRQALLVSASLAAIAVFAAPGHAAPAANCTQIQATEAPCLRTSPPCAPTPVPCGR
jgi:hypothetical protein